VVFSADGFFIKADLLHLNTHASSYHHVMKKLLVFDRERKNCEHIVDMLQIHKPAVRIDEAVSISEVLNKLTFEKIPLLEGNHDILLVVGFNEPEPEILDFVIYLGKNKPDLKVLLYAPHNLIQLEKLNVITGGNLPPTFCTVTSQLNESVVSMLEKPRSSIQIAS
jgi:hypothetical protein